MNNDKLKINPPLYMIGQKILCWRCETRMAAIALLAPNVDDDEGQTNDEEDKATPQTAYFHQNYKKAPIKNGG